MQHVVFNLDLVGATQAASGSGLKVALGDAIENFTGTPLNDIASAAAAVFPRAINGGPHTSVPPGDKLIFDAEGEAAQVHKTTFNTGTIKTPGDADVTFNEIESIAITNSPSGPGAFGLPGSNSGAFDAAHIYNVTNSTSGGKPAPGKFPLAVATGDLNGDGFDDMVTANMSTNNFSVFINNQDGTFQNPISFKSGGLSPTDLVLGHFDAVPGLDLAVTNRGSSNVAIFSGNNAGGFGAPTLIKTPSSPTAIAAGLINGDANADLVITNPSLRTVTVLLGTGTGFFTPLTQVKLKGVAPVDVVIGDFNGDHINDIATANYGSGNVSYLRGFGPGVFLPEQRFAVSPHPTSLAVGDFNNDGKLDLAVSDPTVKAVSLLFGNGAATPATQFQPRLAVAVSGVHASASIVVADFNGDGNMDIGLGNKVGTTFTILLGNGDKTFTQPYEFDLGKESKHPTGGIAVDDLNNDGLIDVIATISVANDVRVLLRHG